MARFDDDDDEATGQFSLGGPLAGGKRALVAALTVAMGRAFGTTVALDLEAETILGRSRDAHLLLPDEGVSRRHASIRRDGGDWFVADLQSKNGTFIGPLRVTEPTKLQEGDTIRLGVIALVVFGFQDPEPNGASDDAPLARDPVTGAYNRRFFEEQLTAEWVRAAKRGQPCAVLLVEVDRFDRHSTAADSVLVEVARILHDCVRHGDLVARLGGERFAILAGACAAGPAVAVAERIRSAIERHLFLGPEVSVRASIGVATSGGSGVTSPRELIARAEAHVVRASAAGGNRVALA